MKGLLFFLYYFIIYIRQKNKSIKELFYIIFLVLFIVFIKNTVNFVFES